MSDDVVAELDAWLDRNPMTKGALTLAGLVKRARDEIVALRETVERQKLVLSKGHAETRAEALGEAARVCERMARHAEGVGQPGFTEAFEEVCATLSAAIRALKDKT